MDDFREFFLLLKEYLQKQRENVALSAAESMTILLSAVATAIVLLVLGGIVLLLTCFALAQYIGELTESAWMGYAVLALAVLLLLTLFWVRRRKWVIQPIARLMVEVFLSAKESDSSDDKTAQ